MTQAPDAPGTQAPPPRRPDASMDLLNALRDTALDPSYAAVSGGGRRVRRARVGPMVMAGAVLIGAFFGIALGHQWRLAPAAAQERSSLVERITSTEERVDVTRAHLVELSREVRDLDRSSGALTEAEQELGDVLGMQVGTTRVVGPGVRVTLDDGSDTAVQGSEVVDTDLRMVVNSLRGLGAEAVAINGRRVSVRTAIRNAGDAITVDYRSLTRPYVVEAIGDARAMADGFAASQGGVWVEGLSQHYGVVWNVSRVGEIAMLADPGLDVERARTAG